MFDADKAIQEILKVQQIRKCKSFTFFNHRNCVLAQTVIVQVREIHFNEGWKNQS